MHAVVPGQCTVAMANTVPVSSGCLLLQRNIFAYMRSNMACTGVLALVVPGVTRCRAKLPAYSHTMSMCR